MEEMYTRQVVARIEKAPDLEVGVCLLTVGNIQMAEVREYVPSLGKWGRGITFPITLLPELLDSLSTVDSLVLGTEGADG